MLYARREHEGKLSEGHIGNADSFLLENYPKIVYKNINKIIEWGG
jgi:hypothetical protein